MVPTYPWSWLLAGVLETPAASVSVWCVAQVLCSIPQPDHVWLLLTLLTVAGAVWLPVQPVQL